MTQPASAKSEVQMPWFDPFSDDENYNRESGPGLGTVRRKLLLHQYRSGLISLHNCAMQPSSL